MNSIKMTLGLVAFAAAWLSGCAHGPPDRDDGELAAAEGPQGVGTARGALDSPQIESYPTPSDVYIESISTGGSGCADPDTVTPVIASDKKSFLLIFDEMILQYPPGPKLKNINCLAGVKLHIPQGWQFSIATVVSRGYAFLENGIRARQTSQYSFAGSPPSTIYHSTLWGPFDNNYEFTDQIPLQSLVRSPCGGSAIFAIDTQLNLNAIQGPNGLGYFNSTEVDGKFTQIFHWEWLPCTP